MGMEDYLTTPLYRKNGEHEWRPITEVSVAEVIGPGDKLCFEYHELTFYNEDITMKVGDVCKAFKNKEFTLHSPLITDANTSGRCYISDGYRDVWVGSLMFDEDITMNADPLFSLSLYAFNIRGEILANHSKIKIIDKGPNEPIVIQVDESHLRDEGIVFNPLFRLGELKTDREYVVECLINKDKPSDYASDPAENKYPITYRTSEYLSMMVEEGKLSFPNTHTHTINAGAPLNAKGET